MRVSLMLAGALLLALQQHMGELHGTGHGSGPTAELRHMRYVREIVHPPAAVGTVCAVLDAAAFAHAQGAGGDDLRVFRQGPQGAVEVPFALTESGAQPAEEQTAQATGIRAHDGLLEFDLAMPKRAYTTVQLLLQVQNFVGIATVSGGPAAVPLGSFAIFDMASRGLGRSTVLPLQETSFARLHVRLQMWNLQRGLYAATSGAMVLGASVPPSREAQTLYTTVSQSSVMEPRKQGLAARLHLPAHVPVERVEVELQPGFTEDFLRDVTVSAGPQSAGSSADIETVHGQISRVQLPLYLDADPAATLLRRLTLETVLAADLLTDAEVEVLVANDGGAPLPLRAVKLQMRQRSVCFAAERGASYLLGYGDPALTGDGVGAGNVSQGDVTMTPLAPENENPAYVPRTPRRSYWAAHPELIWILALAVVAALGARVRVMLRHREGVHRV